MTNNKYAVNDFSNYRIAGNLCNAFAMGKVGSTDDFWIVGSPAPSWDVYPMITGNFLDSSGKLLFRLVRNILVINPGDARKILGNQNSFEIHDTQGKMILKVATEFRDEMSEKGMYVTTVEGLFYNAAGQLIAGSQGQFGNIHLNCPTAFGFDGQWAFASGITNDQLSAAAACVSTNGAIHEIITGDIENQQIDFDGKLFVNATITKCKCVIRNGNFMFQGKCSVTENQIEFLPPANNIYEMLRAQLSATKAAFKSDERCVVSGKYQSAGCGHSTEKTFVAGDTFPSCPQCHRPVAWAEMV